MVGRRAQVETNTNALDRGTAARLAQAICKSRCAPQVEAAITHVGPFRGLRTFWHALQPANAWVGISERDNPNANYPAPDADTTPLQNDGMLRRYGDLQIHSLQSEGEGESLPVVASDQAMNKGWVLHASLDFNRSNTAGASNKAFILGRPNGADLGGWGGLWWDEQTTRLEWWFTDSTATLRGPINTGILVPNTTPNQVVHLTMFRDDAGNWHFWNGAGFVGTVTGFAQDIVNDASDWRFFDSGVGGRAAWAGAIQNWWLLQASSSNMGQSLDSVNQLAVLSSNQGLRRFFGGGLLRYAKFNEPRVRTAGTGDLPPPRCWTFDGTSRYAADFAGSAFVGNGVSFAFNVGRGYRIPRADERSVTRQRRWGAPVVFSVDRVTYTIEPGTGMITTAFRAGRPQSSLTRTLSDLEAQTEGIQTRLRESSNA